MPIKNEITKILEKILKYPEDKNLQQRGIADKIEEACNTIITKNFENVCKAKSRRSIEDINIGNVYIDHKTSDASLKFKMPNLISIDRLRKLDRQLIYNFIIYSSEEKKILKNFCLDVYELNWEHLKIQNLGKGQLQIISMIKFLESPKTKMTKEQWLDKLKEEAILFYKKVQIDAKKRESQWKK
jgi:hypothetical protein